MRWAVVFVLFLAGCKQEVQPSAPSTLGDALAANYYQPWTVEDPDGSGVYFISMKGIWYLKDGVATRVVEAGDGEGSP